MGHRGNRQTILLEEEKLGRGKEGLYRKGLTGNISPGNGAGKSSAQVGRKVQCCQCREYPRLQEIGIQ